MSTKPEPTKTGSTAITEAEKADKVVLWSFAAPHMRSFHLAWFSFFVVSVGGFVPAGTSLFLHDRSGSTSARMHSHSHSPHLPHPLPLSPKGL